MKNFIIICIALTIGITIFSSERPFREDDMLVRNQEVPTNYYQPNWATDSLNVMGLGTIQYFGDTRDVIVIDTLVYACMGSSLVLINAKDKSNPVLVGYIAIPEYAFGVCVSGSYAYVAAYGAGLRIIDISNPENPVEIGYCETPGYAKRVDVSGSYAFVADGDEGLRIINIANFPPKEVGHFDTPDYATDVYVSGNYAYVADDKAGLRIIDISNPSNPEEAGYYDVFGCVWTVCVSGGYTYIAGESFYILDFALTGIEARNRTNSSETGGLRVTMNEIKYKISNMNNMIELYDVNGSKVYEEKNNNIGEHNYNTEKLKSGIYFIKFRDGEREINRKMVIIK